MAWPPSYHSDVSERLDAVGVPAGGTAGQVLAKTSGADFATGWVSVRDVDWTSLVANDSMSSDANWVARAGTWSYATAYGAYQSATNIQDASLEFTGDLSSYDYRAIQAIVRPDLDQGEIGFGFSDEGAWGNNDVSLCLEPATDRLWGDRYGTGTFTGPTIALEINTDYTFQIVERIKSSSFWVYVNGVKYWEVNTVSNTGRVALYMRNTSGYFRDVSIWGGTATFQPPWVA